jgi:hypothetical protein
MGLRLSGKHHMHVCADDVNLLGHLKLTYIDTIKENTEILLDARKDVRLGVNAEKTVYVAVLSPECREKSSHKDK